MGRSGQKVNPVGWRVGIYRKWKNSWIQNKLNYKDLLLTSINTSKLLRSFLRFGKKRRLFFFNYSLLNNNNLDIFCFFSRIKRKKMKFRQKKKRIKRYDRKFKQLLSNYYDKKIKVFFGRRGKFWKKQKNLHKTNNMKINIIKFNSYKKKFKLKKKLFRLSKPIKLLIKSKIKLKLKRRKIYLNQKNIFSFKNKQVKSVSFKSIKKEKKKPSKIKVLGPKFKDGKFLKRLKRKKVWYFYHFFYDIEYFSLFFSFNLLNYFKCSDDTKMINYISSLNIKKLYLNSFLLTNNIFKNRHSKLSHSLMESLKYDYQFYYEKNKYGKQFLKYYNLNDQTFKINFERQYSDNFFFVNKKHKIGKLIKNNFTYPYNLTKNINNNFLFKSQYKFNNLILTNLKFYNYFIKPINFNITYNKIFLSSNLLNLLHVINLYSLRLSYFDRKNNFICERGRLKKTYQFNKNIFNLIKKKKKQLNIFNTTKIFFKYKFFKNPLKLLKSSLTILTGYNTDIFFGSVNTLYKFSRKKYWDPDNLRKLPLYRQKLYLKQVRMRKYEIKKLVFKFYRRVRRRYIRLKNLKFLLRLCMLTSFVKRPIIFARYFCYQINKFPKKYRQIPFLKFIMSTFLTLSKRREILGARIQIQGRFDKWRRSKIIIKESGILTTRKKFFFIEYGSASSFIKKGSFGIKVWLSYRPKFSNFYKKCLISYFNYSNFYKKNISKKKNFLNTFFKFKSKIMKNSRKFKRRKSFKFKNKRKFKNKHIRNSKNKRNFKNKIKINKYFKRSNLYDYYWDFKKTKWLNKKNKINELMNLINFI